MGLGCVRKGGGENVNGCPMKDSAVAFTSLRTGAKPFRDEGNRGKDVCEVTCLALEDAFSYPVNGSCSFCRIKEFTFLRGGGTVQPINIYGVLGS